MGEGRWCALSVIAHDPLTGEVLFSGTKLAGERFTLPAGPAPS